MEEVHLWRGTPEQRELRFAFRKLGQFAYFDRQLDHPDWGNHSVLDFGGNQGNLLRDSGGKIRPQNYYCIDVIKDAIDEGRKQFPEAHWLHYNRYNVSFNPEGFASEPIPVMSTKFDTIVAYSVFTHTTREEMHDLVGQLQGCLAPGGTLAFTFIDPHSSNGPADYRGNNLQWRLDRIREMDDTVDVAALLEKSRGAAWCALVNGDHLHVNSSGIGGIVFEELVTYHVYYTRYFLQQEFPQAEIRPPTNGQMHHCCLIRKGE